MGSTGTPRSLHIGRAHDAGYTARGLLPCARKDLASHTTAGSTGRELRRIGWTPSQLWAAGWTADELRRAGFAARTLYNAGMIAADLIDGGYTVREIRAIPAIQNITPLDNRWIRKCWLWSARELYENGYMLQASDACARDFYHTTSDLRHAGYAAWELRRANFRNVCGVGFTARELRDADFAATELFAAGYEVQELYEDGFTASELFAAGCTADQLCILGCSEEVLTVHVASQQSSGQVALSCCGMDGSEVMSLLMGPTATVGALRDAIQRECAEHTFLQLLLSTGRVLTLQDQTLPLVEVVQLLESHQVECPEENW